MNENQEIKQQINPSEDTLESYLKRGITKKLFFSYMKQIITMYQNSKMTEIQIEMEETHILVKDEKLLFRAYIGKNELTEQQMKEWLKNVAYKTVFTGSDFLGPMHEYLSILDQNHENLFDNLLILMNSMTLQPVMNQSITAAPQPVMNQSITAAPQSLIPQNIPVQQTVMNTNMSMPQQMMRQTSVSPQPYMPAQVSKEQPEKKKGFFFNHKKEDKKQNVYQQINQIPEKVAPVRTIPEPDIQHQKDETSVLDTSNWIPQDSGHALLLDVKNGKQIVINKPCFSLGKDSKYADYAIQNNAISRTHAIIVSRNHEYFITDNGSTNGTFVNGKQIFQGKPVAIKNEDMIKLADLELKFVMQRG